LAAIEHDHAFMTKSLITTTTPTKRRRSYTPTRLYSTFLDSTESKTIPYLNNNSNDGLSNLLTPITTNSSSTMSSDYCTTSRTKRLHTLNIINRATDVKTEDDRTYYLERRRRNNMASKNSRQARQQKYGDMNYKCNEYRKSNEELKTKISILEMATANLKDGLVK
ncbi:unnamed protein product, partial [Didymodactylos carnosus]